MQNYPSYSSRLLEIHGINMWNMFHVDRAVKFAEKYDLTGIIFHCNDLIDRVVFPEKYFSKDELLEYNPVRNSITKNYRYYLRSVLDKCRRHHLEFYAEVKEVFFPYDLLTKYPELRKENGQLCATDPFWWQFLEEKYKEFFELFPEVSGIIVSPGTRESMVSFAANRCTCERCHSYNADDWYHNLLAAMHKSIDAAGKKLIVRDFSYTKAHQYAMVNAAGSVSSNITMAMKKVPHDYYPVFPDNPAVGNCGELHQWVEYDTWGQFFGLGVFPCGVAEDMQGRMQRYLEQGAEGVMLRTDWENMIQSSVFCSFNMLNLIAGAMLSKNVHADMREIYREWLSYGLMSPLLQDTFDRAPCVPALPEAEERLCKIMQLGWKALEKGIHVRGHVFNRNCQMFDRYDLTYNIMTVFHSRDQWEPGASLRVAPTKENIRIILQEKDEAFQTAQKVAELADPKGLGVSEELETYLHFLQQGFPAYIEGFRMECRTTFYTKLAEETKDPDDIQRAQESLSDYESLAESYRTLVRGKGYCHLVEYMLDGDRLLRFKASVQEVLSHLNEGL